MNRTLIREQKAHAERQKKALAESIALMCFAVTMHSRMYRHTLIVAYRRGLINAVPVMAALAIKHPLFTAVQAVRARVEASREEMARRVTLEAKMKAAYEKRQSKKSPSKLRREARRAAERAAKTPQAA